MSDLSAKLDARPATFTCDKSKVGPLYYFAVADRAPGPYKTQRHVEAILDIASDGTLAGVELIDNMPPPPALAQSIRTTEAVDEGASELLREAASQLAAVRADNSDLLAAADADAFTIGTLEAQLKAAREALEQYADEANWRMRGRFNPEHSQFDGITLARAALNPKAPS